MSELMPDPPEDDPAWAKSEHELVAVEGSQGIVTAIGNGSMAEWMRYDGRDSEVSSSVKP